MLVSLQSCFRFLFFAAPLVSLAIADGDTPEGESYMPDIEVRFSPGTDISTPIDAINKDLRSQVSRMQKLFCLGDQELDSLRSTKALARSVNPEGLADLKLWFLIRLEADADSEAFLDALQGQPNVDMASLVPKVAPMPAMLRHLQSSTPQFEARQGYLNAAPEGIDALAMHAVPGGDGAGIKVTDIEGGWTQNHEDLSAAAGVSLLTPPGLTPREADASFINHGTAVLGELVGDTNDLGVTGISPAVEIGLAQDFVLDSFGSFRYVMADVILLTVMNGSPGDVILLEAQTGVCSGECGEDQVGCGPVEWDQSVFDAIATATANGFTVVQAAGNGNVDLDQPACLQRFNRGVRDSGAIIVGAGAPAVHSNPRSRLSFSDYGDRVDVQGWGSDVATTGYGELFAPGGDPTRAYTTDFGGTSSASPIVAGAVASIQGIAKDRFGVPLLPFYVRELLRATGTPQTGNTAENIGPLPNLNAVYELLSFATPEDICTWTGQEGDCMGENEAILLENGSPLSDEAASLGNVQQYVLENVSAGESVTCSLVGPNGDADLYVRFGEEAIADAGSALNDCESLTDTSNEQCTVTAISNTKLYAAVHAFSAYSGLQITCSASLY